MSKYERVKLWVQRHQDAIIAISFGTVIVGLVIVGVKADMSYRDRLSSELNGYIDELNAMVGELKSVEASYG